MMAVQTVIISINEKWLRIVQKFNTFRVVTPEGMTCYVREFKKMGDQLVPHSKGNMFLKTISSGSSS